MARSRLTRFLLLTMLLLPLILMVIRPASGAEAHPRQNTDDVHDADGAHEGYGVIDLAARHPGEAGSVHYVVRVTWSDDGHPAEGATVTATLLDAFGTPLSSLTLDPVDADGHYGGTVVFPSEGLWTVRFTSTVPAGSLDVVEQLPISVPISLPDITLIEFPSTS